MLPGLTLAKITGVVVVVDVCSSVGRSIHVDRERERKQRALVCWIVLFIKSLQAYSFVCLLDYLLALNLVPSLIGCSSSRRGDSSHL